MTVTLFSAPRAEPGIPLGAGDVAAGTLRRHRGLLIAVAVFASLMTTVASIGPVRLTYYDLASMAT